MYSRVYQNQSRSGQGRLDDRRRSSRGVLVIDEKDATGIFSVHTFLHLITEDDMICTGTPKGCVKYYML